MGKLEGNGSIDCAVEVFLDFAEKRPKICIYDALSFCFDWNCEEWDLENFADVLALVEEPCFFLKIFYLAGEILIEYLGRRII